MFWKKKPQPARYERELPDGPPPQPMAPAQELSNAAAQLAASLNAYSVAAYEASKSGPDAELIAAREKVAVARKLVQEGRVA